MAEKIDVAMPQNLDLPGAWTIRATAVDASGSVVAGVKVGPLLIVGDSPTSPTGTELVTGDFLLVPGPDFGGTAIA
jgi:hypothetical protein